jgi:hypothetical protein
MGNQFLNGRPFGLLVFSIVAGFSEKYVPEILAGMERRTVELEDEQLQCHNPS